MSLKSLCEINTCTLTTLAITTGGAGGRIVVPTKYYNAKCRVVPLSADKSAAFGKIGMEIDYQVFFAYNPRTKTAGDKIRRIEFEDENGDTRVLQVEGEKNPDQMNRFWRYDCKESAGVENR